MKWVVGALRFDCNGLRVAEKGGAQQKLFALAAELRCTTKTGSFQPLTRLGDDSSRTSRTSRELNVQSFLSHCFIFYYSLKTISS